MNLKKITLEKEGEKDVQELTKKLYAVCEGKSLPIVFIALSALKTIVQASSKVMTQEELSEFNGKTGDEQKTWDHVRWGR